MRLYHVSFPVRLSRDVYERVKALAQAREMSVSAWLREAIREKLAREHD